MAGAVGQVGPPPCGADDLGETGHREWMAAPCSFERHEERVARRLWPLVVHVAGHRGEEGGRERHQALVSALALSDEHPPLAETQVRETQPEHLAAPQAAQHHGLGHGTVALGAQRPHQRVDLVGIEDPGQPAHPAHQRQAPTAPRAALTSGDAPGHRVGRHVDVVAGDQVAIEARDRSQTALDRRGGESGGTIRNAHHVLGPGLGAPLRGDEGHHVFGPHLERVLLHHAEEDAQVMGIGPHRVRTGSAHHELEELVDQLVADPIDAFTVGTDVTLE